MMNRSLMIAATVGALLIPMTAEAEVRPRAGSLDRRVTTASYQEGQVYQVATRQLNTTIIDVGSGEQILTVSVGDSESFKVEEMGGRNLVSVKPLISGVNTNMVIETNRRVYFLNLIESGKTSPIWMLKFRVPGAGSSRTATASIPPALPMRYKVIAINGGKDYLPVSIRDDGRKTYITFPPEAPIPTAFRADEKGQEYSTNSTVKGTTIIVSSRSQRWVLRYGDTSICIEGE